jgi:DNA polymerase-3 subunit beta
MRFEISRDALLKPLLAICGVVEKRQTLPILANVLIQLEGDRATFTGTDLEIQLKIDIKLEKQVDEPMELTLPARKLTDICRNIQEDSLITFSIEKNRTVVRSGKSRFSLTQLLPQDFPSMDSITAVTSFSLSQEILKNLFERTQFCMANQDVRYYLNGLLFETTGNKINCVATDGHRLAFMSSIIEDSLVEQQIIIPRKGVSELQRLLSDNDSGCDISLNNNFLQVKFDHTTFTAKLIDGRFPDYTRVIPVIDDSNKVLVANREQLKHALIRTSVLSNEKYRGIRFLLNENRLSLSINNPEQEEAEEELDVDYPYHEELEIGFNVSYLIDALNALNDEQVYIRFTNSDSSCLILSKQEEGVRYVVMPMKL